MDKHYIVKQLYYVCVIYGMVYIKYFSVCYDVFEVWYGMMYVWYDILVMVWYGRYGILYVLYIW